MALADAAVLRGRFRILEKGRRALVVREGYEEALGSLLALPAERLAAEAPGPIRRFRGRGSPLSFAIPGRPGERAFVRTYQRGGFVRHLLPDWFLGSARPVRELYAIEQALERGVPTAPVLALHGERRFLGFYAWRIALLEIAGATDLQTYFADRGPRDDARAVIREAARTVAELHAAGLDHADLHLKNLLLGRRNGENVVFVVDLDKASRRDPLPAASAEANLLRLDRSVEKLNRAGVRVSRSDRLRFLMAYRAGELPPGPALRRLLRRRARRLRLHRLSWRLAALLAGTTDA